MANFSSIYTAGARSSFTLELRCSTEGRSRVLARAWGTYLCEALFAFICSFIISSSKQNKVSLAPFSPKRLIPSSGIYLKKKTSLLISMYIDVLCRESGFFL